MRRWLRYVGLATLVAGALALPRLSGASMWGEENITLSHILFETVQSYRELQEIFDAVNETASLANDLLDSYEKVNAGIDELRDYSVSSFLQDFKGDLYHVYPDLAKMEGTSARLRHWGDTHTASPFTAYEAISALAGDLTQPLRDDLKAGRVSVDPERILQTEAAGGFALAEVSEASTRTYDEEILRLRRQYERRTDPGTGAIVAAHANLIIAEQNSHIIRLLARTVRLDGVDKSLTAAARLSALRESYRRAEAMETLAVDTLQPPPLMRFEALPW